MQRFNSDLTGIMQIFYYFLTRYSPHTIVPFLLVFSGILFLPGCVHHGKDFTVYVDPLTGTASAGNTFPGVVVPFGMVQLSPDTRTSGPHSASGYNYADSSILGFSHTHYSGTGRGSGGDFLFMPGTGKIQLLPGTPEHPEKGYRSAFSHKDETAAPGYYKVLLKDDHILAELTATKRTGLHRYTFPKNSPAHVILDLSHGIGDHPDSLYLEIVSDRRIQGVRRSSGGLRIYQTLYFVAEFSRPFQDFGFRVNGKILSGTKKATGKDLQAWFGFGKLKKPLLVKVSISKVDPEGAGKNLAEIPGWNFETVRKAAADAWNRELSKIEVTGQDPEAQRIFYTALYHTCIHPSLDMDIDGRYRSTNNHIYTATGFNDYTNFSLWDTFRGLHPLQALLNRERTTDFIKTFIERFEHSGHLPVFELSGNEVPSMIGYHSLPVIADAWAKGIRDYDINKAIEGMKDLANLTWERRKVYKLFGFVPYDYTRQSVSRTLEYSFDDWCLAQVLKNVKDRDYPYYARRGNFYRNVYCRHDHFMRPRNSRYEWLPDFDPLAYTRYYTQANAWQYTTFVLQDIPELIRMTGGDTAFVRWMDEYFSNNDNQRPGMIGQYNHGNEPSHHAAYLYDYAGAPWKTQNLVRKILTTLYHDTPGGLAGDDDAGQLSAWYVLSAMGFYSVTPGTDYYAIGSPLFNKIMIHLENRNTFTILAKNNAPGHPYIRSATLNGSSWSKPYLRYQDIVNGGSLVFEMSDVPNRQWGSAPENRPPSSSFHDLPVTEVHIRGKTIPPFGEVTFKDACLVSLSNADEHARIYFTTNGKEPDTTTIRYIRPFHILHTSLLKARAYGKGALPGYTMTVRFRKLTPLPAVKVLHPQKGLRYTYREVWLCKDVKDIFRYPLQRKGILPALLPEAPFPMSQKYGMTYEGYFKAPQSGTYTFYLASDDGSILKIDSVTVVTSSGHERTGRIALEKGYHRIDVKHFQVGGKPWLKVSWEGPGIRKEEMPEEVFYLE